MDCEHAETVVMCKDVATMTKRKRFDYCAYGDRCCSDCSMLATCQFVCPKLKEEEEVEE